MTPPVEASTAAVVVRDGIIVVSVPPPFPPPHFENGSSRLRCLSAVYLAKLRCLSFVEINRINKINYIFATRLVAVVTLSSLLSKERGSGTNLIAAFLFAHP